MVKLVRLRTREHEFQIELNDSDTAHALWLALPIEAYANLWGEEIYFEIPVKMRLENGRKEMEVGEVAYWPAGQAFCIFFGRTPVSTGAKPVAYSEVTPLGKVIGDPQKLEAIGDRTKIVLEQMPSK
jgi:hypothetical protein